MAAKIAKIVVGDFRTTLHAEQRSLLRLSYHFRTAIAGNPIPETPYGQIDDQAKRLFHVTHQRGQLVGEIPTPLLPRVEELMTEFGIPFSVEDTRTKPAVPTFPTNLERVPTRPHQIAALQRMLAKRGGILKSGNVPANVMALATLGQALATRGSGTTIYCRNTMVSFFFFSSCMLPCWRLCFSLALVLSLSNCALTKLNRLLSRSKP